GPPRRLQARSARLLRGDGPPHPALRGPDDPPRDRADRRAGREGGGRSGPADPHERGDDDDRARERQRTSIGRSRKGEARPERSLLVWLGKEIQEMSRALSP